jgi:hypothetical protein
MDLVADASTYFGSNRYLWQTHVSNDDTILSGTLRDSATYESLGCLVYNENSAQFSFFAKTGAYDECHGRARRYWSSRAVGQRLRRGYNTSSSTPGQQATLMDQAGAPTLDTLRLHGRQ